MDFVSCFYAEFRDPVTLQIFSYLNPSQLCLCSSVSRGWKRIANHELLWKRLAFAHYSVVEKIESMNEHYVKMDLNWKELYRNLFQRRRKMTQLAGRFHSAVIVEDGRLAIWGRSAKWLGLTLSTDGNSPLFLPSFVERLAMISGHYAHFAALTESGSVYTWGRGQNGELGLGKRENVTVPTRIGAFENLGTRAVHVSAGYVHMAASTESGGLYTWGCADFGRLGHGETATLTEPHRVEALRSDFIIGCAAGGAFTIALSHKGDVFLFGSLCEFDRKDFFWYPKAVQGFKKKRAVGISAGDQHAAVVTADGKLYTWGLGTGHRLGHGDTRRISTPRKVEDLSHLVVSSVSAGFSHTACVTESGEIYTWGWGQNGQLGHAVWEDARVPQRVDALAGIPIAVVSAGYLHTMAVSVNGALFGWGENAHGQLGLGSFVCTCKPYQVTAAGNSCWWKSGHGFPLVI